MLLASCGPIALAQTLPDTEQPLPSFEVAAIRPSAPADQGWEKIQVAPMRFRVQDATVSELIQFAYDIRTDEQLQSEPHWTRAEKFDVDAKIDDAQAAVTMKLSPSLQMNQYRLMLQSLLKRRFFLKVHTERKKLSVYALEVAKGGPKLKVTATPLKLPSLGGWSGGSIDAHAVTMTTLSEGMSGRKDVDGRIVIDATGLNESYDFTLHWSSAESLGDSSGSAGAGVPLFTALREQLGLKLSARKAAVRVLIIDHIEHPSEN